ncbi:hypothetical protein AB0467_15505 [Streptomyces sp. NPDC052095]|uniref:hypothetical protein n=1 Tax=unclassified Streptomyces TaxID=2593676 RepID=UPI00344E21FA
MPHRLLRTAVLAAVAAGAVLAPSAAAFADTTPKPATPSVEPSAVPSKERARAAAAEAAAGQSASPSVMPRGGVAAGESPTPVPARTATAEPTVRDGAAPRGGVDAGERPAGTSGDSTPALAGSAAGALLLAGAGTFVLRRRSAARQNG